MKKISICIPVLNEEENILNTYEKIKNIFTDNIKDYDYELIFTDNHSSDSSEKILLDLINLLKTDGYKNIKDAIGKDL